MKSALTAICVSLLLAVAAQGAKLTSAQSSYHAYGNFAILVLRFDGPIDREVQPTEGGAGAVVTIANCDLTPKAAGDLAAARNLLLMSAQTQTGGQGLELHLKFAGAMKLRVSDTDEPRSVVLDFAPVESPHAKADDEPLTLDGKPLEPIKKYRKAASEEPPATGSLEYYIAKGKLALAANKENAALDNFEKALRLAPNSPEVHYLLGLLQRKWGHPEAAIPHLQKAKADSGFLPLAAGELASIYHQLGRTSEEEVEWETFFAAMKKMRDLPDSLPDEDSALEALHPDSVEKPAAAVVPPPADSVRLASVVKPEKPGMIMPYLLYAALALLTIVIAMLYVRQKELQRTIQILIEKDDEPPHHAPPPPAPVPMPAPAMPAIERPRPAAPSQPRGAEETAREVLGLYKAGMSIQGIAERLGIGQDEVKLILNLQREEGKG